MLIFYLHENKTHVLTLQEPSCSMKESISMELCTGVVGLMEHTRVYACSVLIWH